MADLEAVGVLAVLVGGEADGLPAARVVAVGGAAVGRVPLVPLGALAVAVGIVFVVALLGC